VNPVYRRIYRVVARIPRGRVSTYGVVARLAGRPGAARLVGWALAALPVDSAVPWWRVLNATGRISRPAHDHNATLQRALLLGEGVRFSGGGVVALVGHGWPAEAYATEPPGRPGAARSKRSRRSNELRP
jgi:methylated-DNA-protein-cysteine methyltransferase-like protein